MASFRRRSFLAALIVGLCAACTEKPAAPPASAVNSLEIDRSEGGRRRIDRRR